MLSDKRKYNFIGELTLNRSQVLDLKCQPKDDKVNWLFLRIGENRFSFVYKIKDPLKAEYDKPFKAELAFTMIESIKDTLDINSPYEVWRGEEPIGSVIITEILE